MCNFLSLCLAPLFLAVAAVEVPLENELRVFTPLP
jgi:hypothetical protein